MSAAALLLLALLSTTAEGSGEPVARWDRFRGPEGRGIALDGAPLPATLDLERDLRWRVPLSPGNSSPCVWDELVVVTGASEARLETLALERASGRVRWRRSIPYELTGRIHEVNGPASSTPAVDAERVYVYFPLVGLLCYDHEGQELWRRTWPQQENTFGAATSPVVQDGTLYLVRDGEADSALLALDARTGEDRWRVEREGFRSGWSTPVLRRAGEVQELLVYGAWWLKAYDATTGEERWAFPGLTDEPIVTPVVDGGLVYLSSYNMRTNPEVIGLPAFAELLAELDTDGDGRLEREEAARNQSVLSRSDADGEGDHPLRIFFRFLDEDEDGFLTEEEWRKIFAWLAGMEHANAVLAIRPGAPGRAPAIAWQHGTGVPECPTPLVHDGRVLLVKNGGLATCLDARTGALVHQGRLESRGPCYASPVLGDGKVYTASARGVVTVLRAGETLEVLSRNDLGERILATPALAGGTVLVRTEKSLLAFGAD